MECKFLDHVIEIFRKNSIGIIPCSQEEIFHLETHIGAALPESYREYLRLMGKYSGTFNVGSDCFYDDVFSLNEDAQQLLIENNVVERLPTDAFVFCMHHGYIFNYFRLSEGPNPPVYSYSETTNELRKIFPSFSDYLLAGLDAHGIK
jgi:hypothetical protein